MYDLIIRDGTVVDGSGLPAYVADIAVKDNRIEKIGRVTDAGRREIKAEGKIVAMFADGGWKYLSTGIYGEDFKFEQSEIEGKTWW